MPKTLDSLVPAYFKHLSPEAQLEWNAEEHRQAAQSHLDVAAQRLPGTANIRISPDPYSEGSLIEIVTDDMPFLIDSVGMALNDEGFDVLGLVHPQFDVRRDVLGNLVDVVFDGSQPAESQTDSFESWMRIETEHIPDAEKGQVQRHLEKVLQDVREAVEDWPKMHAQVDRIVADLETNDHGLATHEVEMGREFLRWLADDHFTFLGYREYLLERQGNDEVLRAVPASGLGILRGDQQESPSFSKLPPLVRARARDKNLLVLAKANSRATVHRPVHLDYIGVKTFDASGEVNGEQRFLGLFSSGAYTESIVRIPMLREKVDAVIAQAGFEPNSHAAKALLDVLETYPRDELFQTDVDDLTRISVAVMQSRERRALRLFVRRDIYGRFLSCLVYLPRDRYNTAVREKFARILKESLHGETVEFTVRLSESFSARVHFVVRPKPGESIPEEIDVAAIERKLQEAARSWDEDLAAELRANLDDDGALARAHSTAFPEAYKEDYPATTGAVDLGRIVALPDNEVAVALERAEDPRSARLKIYRTGDPLVLSHILPMLSSLGVEVTDER
ncbi:MAG TPA: NAD-glutamate dehydrogenase, partial [Marmoricola sp.]|nr:NAD-glutamate dehydrogenase [Marmoricola sp.]